MQAHNIAAIDLLVVNLYPFEATVAGGGDYAACVENIDIGGPAMIRAAAKNHADVTVLVDGDDYQAVLAALAEGGTTQALRRRLAQKAYARTAAYDAAISNWMAASWILICRLTAPLAASCNKNCAMVKTRTSKPVFMPATSRASASPRRHRCRARNCLIIISMTRMPPLNWSANLMPLRLLPAPLSNTPIRAVSRWATGDLPSAFEKALLCDPVSAFGGIIAMNQKLDAATATAITAFSPK